RRRSYRYLPGSDIPHAYPLRISSKGSEIKDYICRPHPPMNNRARNILYTIILLASVYVVYTIRKKPDEPRIAFGGRTMGTTYSIIYYDKKGRDFQKAVDSVLVVFNQSLNTYLPDSEISRFIIDTYFRLILPFFYPVLKRSKEIYECSGGVCDPTVMPLVNAWGFGPA